MFFFKMRDKINTRFDKPDWYHQLPNDIALKHHPRAKRLTLRHQPSKASFVLTLPKNTSQKTVLSFLDKYQPWIEEHRQKNYSKQPFENGAVFIFLGQELTIRHVSLQARGLTKIQNKQLNVHGDPTLINARVIRFCKNQAKSLYADKIKSLTAQLDLPMPTISIRDPQTRWGSCHSDGRISLSWRLVLAPPFVMNYVLSHEVAHLIHMNHSRDFWNLCQELEPRTKEAEKWLKKNGSLLHQWG